MQSNNRQTDVLRFAVVANDDKLVSRKSGDEILDLLDALNREHNKTIVMVTHDPHAANRAKRTLHLEKGVLVTEAVA